MAAQKGKDILLKIGDGETPEVFTTVAGLRARTISLKYFPSIVPVPLSCPWKAVATVSSNHRIS